MSLLLYNISTAAYTAGIRVASLWNRKARLWTSGRKNIFNELKAWKSKLKPTDRVVWMHCASLGEFEQGRPVAEALKARYPGIKLLITFFSPSGYTVRKHYPGADGVFYLPADSKKNADNFIRIINPLMVVWVKYEYWYHYLVKLRSAQIPVLLVSAKFRESQPFFKSYGRIWREMLQTFTQIFVQDKESADLIKISGIKAMINVAGDTRFDRVIAIAESSILPEKISGFCKGHKVIVAGSTWEEDEEELVHYARQHPQLKFIIAPHEIDEERLQDIKKLFARPVFYSEAEADHENKQVLIIDNIGMLSSLYRVADIAYIGGGFNASGIHNILEAAVYGKPVLFGPEYEKFREAVDLVELGAAFPAETALEQEAVLDRLLNNEDLLMKAGRISREYVYEKRGATDAVMSFIYENRLVIS